jgi:hypothetical protein
MRRASPFMSVPAYACAPMNDLKIEVHERQAGRASLPVAGYSSLRRRAGRERAPFADAGAWRQRKPH